MSKVLVDRELLEKHVSEIDSWNASMEKIIGKQPDYRWASLETLREALAQPAEAEGVAVVAEVSLRNKQPVGVPMLREGGGWTLQAGEKLVRQSDHLAALSAVTAERDRLREENQRLKDGALEDLRLRTNALELMNAANSERDRLDAECGRLLEGNVQDAETIFVLEAERDQLRAEAEALRKDAERYRMFRHGMFDPDRFDADIDAAIAASTNKESKL